MYIRFLLARWVCSLSHQHAFVVDIKFYPVQHRAAYGRAAVLAVMGATMSPAWRAVFKHIPEYYPQHVGAVGGGEYDRRFRWFVLPIAFVYERLVGISPAASCRCFNRRHQFVGCTSILVTNRQRFQKSAKTKDLPELRAAALQRAKAESDAANFRTPRADNLPAAVWVVGSTQCVCLC